MIAIPTAIKMRLTVLYEVSSSIMLKAKPIAKIIVPRNESHIFIDDLPIIYIAFLDCSIFIIAIIT